MKLGFLTTQPDLFGVAVKVKSKLTRVKIEAIELAGIIEFKSIHKQEKLSSMRRLTGGG
jgi:hypothetical protein